MAKSTGTGKRASTKAGHKFTSGGTTIRNKGKRLKGGNTGAKC